MDRDIELSLLDELLALKASGARTLDAAVGRNDFDAYRRADTFARERAKIFRRLPTALAHCNELPEAGSFLRRELGGLPVLLTRDEDGEAHAFLNICRHRGTRLVEDNSGCRKCFVCPYHAWTYDTKGALTGAPHFDEGFGALDKATLGLRELPIEERYGLLWAWPTEPDGDAKAWLGDLAAEFDALGIDQLRVAASDEQLRKANWKLLAEGGLESYHFRVAHRNSIGPHFEDNLSIYQRFGPHMRFVLPRGSIAKLPGQPRDRWRLRDHANVLYTVFPSSTFLLMQDHIAWIQAEALAPNQTRMRITTLVPTDGPLAQGKDDRHWQENHQITLLTLGEDFDIGESIQASVDSGIDAEMLFGRFEGALARHNEVVAGYLGR